MPDRLKTILSIAGSDSCGGAGIQADIKAAAFSGVYAMTAVTAVTAQNSGKVYGVMNVSPDMLRRQIETVVEDQLPDAIKIGMTGSLDNCKIIRDMLEGCLKGIPVVIDPVISATSGGLLSDGKERLLDFYINDLLPMATVVTPNLHEAEMILEVPLKIDGPAAQSEAASFVLDKLGCKSVALKGGHLGGDSIYDAFVERTDDGSISYSGHSSQRVKCANLHGTGCTFSTLMACAIACGQSLSSAFTYASSKMGTLIADSCSYTFGMHNNGPLNVFGYKTDKDN